jgi:hypothetical protein
MKSRKISGEALGGVLQTQRGEIGKTFAIGPFSYVGAGREAQSADPRFEGVRVSSERGLYHRCGHQMEIVYDRPTGEPSEGLDASFSVRFATEFGLQYASGKTAAVVAGAIPVVNGYKPGANWPIHAPAVVNAFIGLMHPEDGRPETLIVRFDRSADPVATKVLARLPMRFQSISVLPNLHKAGAQATLVGKDPNGPYRSIVLEMPDNP